VLESFTQSWPINVAASGSYLIISFICMILSHFEKTEIDSAKFGIMSAKGAKNIPEKDWLAHRQTLKRLWLDERKKLQGEDGVMDFMETRYEFVAT